MYVSVCRYHLKSDINLSKLPHLEVADQILIITQKNGVVATSTMRTQPQILMVHNHDSSPDGMIDSCPKIIG